MRLELVFCHPDGGMCGRQFPISISQVRISPRWTICLSLLPMSCLVIIIKKLYVSGMDGAKDVALRIMNHTFSLNVQQLNITCLFKYGPCSFEMRPGLPLSLSGSQTLKHLTLSWHSVTDHLILTSTHGREFSSLTTLHLYYITLYDDFLSMCPNLENLTLHRCKMTGGSGEVLSICHPRLSNLTLENGEYGAHIVNVFAPQLKDLTISRYFGGFRISAPQLASLLIRGYCPYMFSTTDGFHSLEKAQLSLRSLRRLSRTDDSTVISLLQEFHNVKFLSLSVDVIQLLNSSVKLISHQPSPLANLKSLKILPKVLCMTRHKHTKVFMSTEVKRYLLNSSQKATLTEVLRDHCCDVGAGAPLHSI